MQSLYLFSSLNSGKFNRDIFERCVKHTVSFFFLLSCSNRLVPKTAWGGTLLWQWAKKSWLSCNKISSNRGLNSEKHPALGYGCWALRVIHGNGDRSNEAVIYRDTLVPSLFCKSICVFLGAWVPELALCICFLLWSLGPPAVLSCRLKNQI